MEGAKKENERMPKEFSNEQTGTREKTRPKCEVKFV